ncbi:acyltransferase [Saccharospirillum salsuginis]|nr:acyltransferase [Saccharospirillum salsuginis]
MKAALKTAVKKVFLLLLLPLYLLLQLFTLFGQSDSLFQSLSQWLSLIPGKLGIYCRAAFYHWACPQTSDDICIGFLTVLSHRNTTLKRGVYIGPQSNIGMCTIEEDTLLGSGVHILSGNKQHLFDDTQQPIQQQGGTYTKILIGRDCWLGNGALVMADIDQQAIIAAGSVVIRPVEAGAVYGGNPARFIQSRFSKQSNHNQSSRQTVEPT